MTRPSAPRRLVRAAVALGVLSVAAFAIEGRTLSDRIVSHDRMYDTAADENASPADIVEAGRAVDAATSGEATLVAYTVHNDDDEGRSAAAWRLYDADGDTLAQEHAGVTQEGHAHPELTAVPGGFLVEDEDGPTWFVTPAGAREKVTRADSPLPTRRGDVVLEVVASRLLFRPAARMLFRPTPKPYRNPQGWALAGDASTWMQGTGVREGQVPFYRSRDGGAWEPAAGYRLRKRQWVTGLTGVGDRMVAAIATESVQQVHSRLTGLLVRQAAAPAKQVWRLLPARGVRGRSWVEVQMLALDATTVAVGEWGSAMHLVDLERGTWTPMPPPTGEDGWAYQAQDGRLFAFNGRHADAWVSDDRGRHWGRLPH